MKTEDMPQAPVDAVVRLPIDERLESLRHCIVHGRDEDAQNHICALLQGLRVKYTPDEQLTTDGRKLKSEWPEAGENKTAKSI